jgi:predicted Zn-ribbon and HTH transcriptional regulator
MSGKKKNNLKFYLTKDRQTGYIGLITPKCNSCGFVGKFKLIEYDAGDFDLECPKCKSTDIWEDFQYEETKVQEG